MPLWNKNPSKGKKKEDHSAVEDKYSLKDVLGT